MQFRQKPLWHITALLFIGTSVLSASDGQTEPVTPNASPEAKALLKFIYSISGKYILPGQHNYPNTKDRNSQFATKYIGKTPPVWSTDWGFAEDGDTDSYLARPDIVEEAKRQHRLGSLVTICWHAVPPTADEPVTFRPIRDAAPESLATVQGQLLDQQFKDVLTPGTELHKRWCAQVDTIAFYLKKLQEARVPILWRPYHEMNGNWFWWGGRHGEYGTRALYRQIFDRLVKHHKINNLVWLWSVDRAHRPDMHYSHYYPGNAYLDVLSLDVYGSDFSMAYYDSLLALSQGKPLVLGEVGNPPTLEILDNQSNWALWVVWAGMVRNTSKKQYAVYVDDPRVLFLEDPTYWKLMAPYRKACNLSLLPVKQEGPINFTGTWIFDEENSTLDNFGIGNVPYKMTIAQEDNDLIVEKSFIVEWGDDRVTIDSLTMDGKEFKSVFWNSPRITTVNWTEVRDTLLIESKVTFNMGDRTSEMVSTEAWTLQQRGNILSIIQQSRSFRGDRKITMIFNKQNEGF
jgi:mannan endo-1,4-beta-mannosidase